MVAGATAGLRLPLLSRWSADGQPQASAHGAQPHSDPKDAHGSRFASCRAPVIPMFRGASCCTFAAALALQEGLRKIRKWL